MQYSIRRSGQNTQLSQTEPPHSRHIDDTTQLFLLLDREDRVAQGSQDVKDPPYANSSPKTGKMCYKIKLGQIGQNKRENLLKCH